MKVENYVKPFLKTLPDIRPGDEVKVYQKIREKDKDRIQTFEGLVIARKHGREMGATITLRKVIAGVGVEKIIPLHLPTIEKIEVLKRGKVRRAKLYYLRKAKGKKARLKRQEFLSVAAAEENPPQEKSAAAPEEAPAEKK